MVVVNQNISRTTLDRFLERVIHHGEEICRGYSSVNHELMFMESIEHRWGMATHRLMRTLFEALGFECQHG